MLNSIGLTFSAFIFTVLITVVYIFKKKYQGIQNMIYRSLLVITLVILVLEFICIYTMSISDQIPLINEFLCRIYLLVYLAWFVSIIGYVRSISINKVYKKSHEFFEEPFIETV